MAKERTQSNRRRLFRKRPARAENEQQQAVAQPKEFKEGDHSFEAEDQSKAKEAFYSLVGGTPAEIGKEFVDNQIAKGKAYHQTEEGGSPTVAKVKTTGDLSELAVYFKHPLG